MINTCRQSHRAKGGASILSTLCLSRSGAQLCSCCSKQNLKHETVFCQTPRENRVHCPLQKSPGTMDQVGPLKQPSPACVSSVLFARFTHSLLIVINK